MTHHMSEPVRLELDGITYRVFDATMRGGKLIVANPPVPWATSRVFRPRKGHRRLQRADYLPTMPAGAVDQDPR
jgi:hypothetical protein